MRYAPGGLLGLFALSAFNLAPLTANAVDLNVYQLTFADEFDQPLALSSEGLEGHWADHWLIWGMRHQFNNGDEALKAHDSYMLQDGWTVSQKVERSLWNAGVYVPPPYLHEVREGVLYLRGYPGRVQTYFNEYPVFDGLRYTAGMISGERLFRQKQGYWEINLRAAVPTGHHLAVWLMEADGSWPPEIDILEAVGHDPERFYMFSHLESEDPPITVVDIPEANEDGFYKLGFEWTDTQLRWYLNDQLVRQQWNGIGDHEMSIVVSWEIGGNWTGDPDVNTVWPAEVAIDYIRIYQDRSKLSDPELPVIYPYVAPVLED